MKILVTGGAGYIASHVIKLLGDLGYKDIVVIDNLSTGKKDAILYGKLYEADLNNTNIIDEIFRKEKIDVVMHFAAAIRVDESVRDPLKYYKNNTINTINLAGIALKNAVKKFIFSSTAAVYGEPNQSIVNEDSPLKPINPYGYSKLMSEQVIKDIHNANPGFNYVILRYFNVAGADPDLRIGQNTPNATHLIKVAVQTALGLREHIEIYGTNYNTPDGTAIRDYIHVLDLAQAHIDALKLDGSDIFNIGYGRGYSVREVIDAVKEVSKVNFKVIDGPRRAGDPEALIADSSKIKKILGWKPRYDNLNLICKTAFQWEKKISD